MGRRAGVADMLGALLRTTYRTARRIPGCLPERLRVPAHLAISRKWYDFVNRLDPEGEARFFNYGWIAGDGAECSDGLEDCQAALYGRVAAVCLRGKDVLEVGCGRGGGAWWIWRQQGPRLLVGLDLSGEALKFCTGNYRADRLEFVQGTAGRLPFADGSFDAVVSVESSHGYPSMEDFLNETARVLRPGGALLFADFRPHSELGHLRGQFAVAGLHVDEQEDLSEGVLRALEATDGFKRRLIAGKAPWFARAVLEDFAGLCGTPIHTGLRTGNLAYVRFLLRKGSA